MALRAFRIRPGSIVRTADGQTAGHVGEVSGAHFKVAARWRRDYWLPTSIVDTADQDVVLLAVPKNELRAYQMERPDFGEMDTATGGAQALFSEAELLEQRARMEAAVTGEAGSQGADTATGTRRG
jgi:hypothetical protein